MRRSERVLSEIPMVWKRGNREVACIGRDMSVHGFFLQTNEDVDPGTLMQMTVTLGKREFRLFGVARFVGRTSAGPGVGVEIFLLDRPGQAAWLEHYRELLWRAAVGRGEATPRPLARRQSWQQQPATTDASEATFAGREANDLQ